LEKLDMLYLHVEGKSRVMIGWYIRKKRSRARWSRTLRFLAISFAGIGGICPLLQNFGEYFNQMGYVAFGITAMILGFDKFFGFSNAWMRYMMTQIRLQKKLRSFVDKDLTQTEAEALFSFLHTFQEEMMAEVEQETHYWITEFQSNLVQLDKTREDYPPSAS
jgi:SMODS and SLOG-associating 2TM effector domain 2